VTELIRLNLLAATRLVFMHTKISSDITLQAVDCFSSVSSLNIRGKLGAKGMEFVTRVVTIDLLPDEW
jgi:hypothetical protein